MLKIVAFGIVAGALLAAIAAWVRIARKGGRKALRKAFSGYAVAVGVYLGAGGAALSYAYDREMSGVMPFLVLGAGVTLMMSAGRAWNHAVQTRSARVGAVALGVAGMLAVAWLAMLTSPPLLDGFGL
jgi:hypothetical protein